MSSSSGLTANISGKRSRSKVGIYSEDETNASKRLKPDCCRVNDINDMNKSRIYNFGYRKKPAELFRKDLISAMKMADTEQLNREDYLPITESWREEWEKGVQVPVNPDHLPDPVIKVLRDVETSEQAFKLPKKLIKCGSECEPIASNYELDLQDLCWLEAMTECDNSPQISDNQLEEAINQLEQQCARNIKARQVGIEYDDHIICDVCRSPDAEEGNEMVFCDLCNICVHQACYGITEIPEGDWLCRPCKEFGSQKNISCVLCPNFGGALKPTSSGKQWAHVSCSLWVPEVSIGCVNTMEPITKIKQIPQTRWNLVCSLCNVKQGAPIQCSVKTCKIAYHVICAFNHKLKMKAIVESDKTKGVKLKSYCKKHTEKGDIDDDGKLEVKSESTENTTSQPKTQHEIEIATSIPEEEDKHENDFWKYIDIIKVQQELIRLNPSYAQNKNFHYLDFIVQYWKMKRTSNYGASLIKLTSSAQFQEQQQQQRNEILRLRVDLERIRNLSYMICRREKVKRNWISSHQSTVETSLSSFTGVNTSESPSKSGTPLTDETTKLVCDIITNSVIYNLNESEHKTRTNCIVRQLRKLSKLEQIQKRRPNPYAKYYISTHLKRKHEDDSAPITQPIDELQSTVNNSTNTSLDNSVINRNKNDKPINGLSSPKHQMKYNSVPVNGLHNNLDSPPEKVCSPDRKSGLNYRQSPRSLLKPKLMSPSNVINSNNEGTQKPFTTLVPVLTRSNLSGYKIPKKKQEQNSQPSARLALEIDEKIEKFKRRLDPELYSDRSPDKSPTKMSFNQTTQLFDSSQEFEYFNKNISHSQRGQYLTRGKSNGFHNNSSLLRTRGQHNVDEDALMASAKNDIDMRRHQSSGFRHSIIH